MAGAATFDATGTPELGAVPELHAINKKNQSERDEVVCFGNPGPQQAAGGWKQAHPQASTKVW